MRTLPTELKETDYERASTSLFDGMGGGTKYQTEMDEYVSDSEDKFYPLLDHVACVFP